jgi:SAM-dependent methyltransferase
MSFIVRLRRRREAWLAMLNRRLGRRRFSAQYFDRRFRVRDPWGYEWREYEAGKYQHTLAAVPRDRYATALEIACAEAVFTELLGPRVCDLLAVDISNTALKRARERTQHLHHVHFRNWDLFADPPLGRFDLIVCSEVLCFAERPAALTAAREKIVSMLAPGGDLVLTHLRIRSEHPGGWDADDLLFGADSIHPWFAEHPALEVLSASWNGLYAVTACRQKRSD